MDSNSEKVNSDCEQTSQTTEDHPSSLNEQKKNDILEACKAHDIDALVRLATSSGGLLQDDVRQVACKISIDLHGSSILTNTRNRAHLTRLQE